MQKVAITIGREFGSGGREIGEKLASKLGISFYDKELIELAAKKSGIHADVLKGADEVAGSPFFNGFEQASINDRLYSYQREVILEIAARESCVIVGRCADYILTGAANCIRVFIYADMEYKIQKIMARHSLKDPDLVRKIIQKTDKNRRTYYQYYTDHKWGDSEYMDMMINSSLLGVDGTVSLLEYAIKLKQEM